MQVVNPDKPPDEEARAEPLKQLATAFFGLVLIGLGALLAFMVWLGPQYEGWRLEQIIYGGIPALIGIWLIFRAGKKLGD